jgi:hypothetical protein
MIALAANIDVFLRLSRKIGDIALIAGINLLAIAAVI